MEWHKSKYQAHEHQERAPEAAPHVPSHKDAGIGLTDPLEQAIQLLSEKTSRKH